MTKLEHELAAALRRAMETMKAFDHIPSVAGAIKEARAALAKVKA